MAIDLDTVQGKGDGCDLFWIKYFSQIRLEYSEESSALQLDIYAMHDVLMVIQNGIMRVAL